MPEFRLLGDIEVRLDGRPIAIGYARLRHVLAVLLLEINRPVPVDEIVGRVWGERRLPRNPRGAVQHSVSVLRQALAVIEDVSISRRPAGYQLDADAGTVDVHRFAALLREARATEEDERAAELFEQALELWRGELCTGLDTRWAESERAALDAQCQAARCDLTDIRLRLGRHTALLAELSGQAQRYPLDERVAGQYLLALYRSGRQAQAFEYYHQVRHRLAEQLGVDPSASLQRLYQRILAADPELAAPERPPSPGLTPVPVPRQLPARPRSFTGRERELDDLTTALNTAEGPGGTMVISAIGGSGGIGKTWLALHWAHENLDRFPDGQLHVNLRGFDPTGEPMPPAVAVRGFLDALGAGPAALPSGEDAQVGLYRSLVADRKMLIVLDNARDSDQIAPLLPGSTSCTVVITSRRRLTGLVTGHGAHILDLDVLGPAEARDLLARRLGNERVAAEPRPLAELLEGCAGLPLALGIVAARAAAHPGFPLASLAGELRDLAGRLDTLDGGELATNMRAVLSWSYHALAPETATVFALLGLVPGPDIDTAAAASLTALPATRIRAILRDLESASLVQQHVPGRYRMHDLVRLYAAEQAQRDGDDEVRTSALRRLTDFYLHTALNAEQLLQSLLPPIELGEPAAGCHPSPLNDQATALAWFTIEYPNLLAMQRLAAAQGWAMSVWRLARSVTTFLYRQGRFPAALTALRTGEAAVADLDDPIVATGSHQLLGAIFSELGQYDNALRHLTLAEQGGDLPGQAYTDHTLGWLWSLRGDNQRALRYATRALHRYRSLNMVAGQSRELTVIGWYLAQLGEYDKARTQCAAALGLARRHGQVEDEGLTLGILGHIAHHTGKQVAALGYLRQALAILREIGNTYYEATVLDYLGRCHEAIGDIGSAHAAWREALRLYRIQHRTTDAERLDENLGSGPAS
ncbi:AfsR/SARP family transcriptional regulator [Amycolatopsis pigmentata]|uniref:BTAD domain-containing putative transcriptional regulator n=1 Tax=Amycolatopsis pigmentata TaxID=450801 RepID=A0ABW5FLC1_9PSEU